MNLITMISSNIRFENPLDGKFDWPYRRDFLVKEYLNNSPFIIGTQEGKKAQLYDLQKLLKEYEIIDQHREWIEERMYPSLFIKKNIGKINDSGDIWLSETPYNPGSKSFNSAFPRLCTWAKITVKNKKFLIINTHLDHLNTQTRQKQIEVLLFEMKKINQERFPIIMMGDFNEGPKGPVRDTIQDSDLSVYDPWFKLKKNEETSYHKFQGRIKNGSRIDWILLDENLKVQNIIFLKNHNNGVYPSDHFILCCNFFLS